MPTPRKPTQLKVITGSKRIDPADAATEIVALTECPAAPDWLPNGHAKKEWFRLSVLLVANKLLADTDLTTLGHLCAVHGKMVQLYAAGETPVASMVAQYKSLAEAFGLAAGWRSKVKPSGEGESGSKFARFKKGGAAAEA